MFIQAVFWCCCVGTLYLSPCSTSLSSLSPSASVTKSDTRACGCVPLGVCGTWAGCHSHQQWLHTHKPQTLDFSSTAHKQQHKMMRGAAVLPTTKHLQQTKPQRVNAVVNAVAAPRRVNRRVRLAAHAILSPEKPTQSSPSSSNAAAASAPAGPGAQQQQQQHHRGRLVLFNCVRLCSQSAGAVECRCSTSASFGKAERRSCIHPTPVSLLLPALPSPTPPNNRWP